MSEQHATADEGQLTFREQVHVMLRESILDAAWSRALESDWDVVRISDIARDVGVSRQTIYNEFGTKQRLAEEMFNREMEEFLAGLLDVVRQAESPSEGIRESLVWLFRRSRDHAMLSRMVTDAQAGRSTQLLPLLTVNGHLIARPMRVALAAAYQERWGGQLEEVERLTDLLVRLAMGAILMPSDFGDEAMIDDLVDIASLAILRMGVD